MRAQDAATRMVLLENHGQEFSVEQFIQWLLSLDDDDPDQVGRVVLHETRRARALAVGHYQKVGDRVAVGSVDTDVVIAFMQGAAFAAAALGRKPFPASVD